MAADNPILSAAQRQIGPLPAWQWGAGIGAVAVAWRFLRPKPAAPAGVRIAAGGGIDRRPVAPVAGFAGPGAPAPAFSDQTGSVPFLSVTTPGGINIGGEGLTPGGIVEILASLIPPPSATVNVPGPSPSGPPGPPPGVNNNLWSQALAAASSGMIGVPPPAGVSITQWQYLLNLASQYVG